MANVANLRYKIDVGEIHDTQYILNELDTIESELEEWAGNISPSCSYEVVSTPRPFHFSPGFKLTPYKAYSQKYAKFWAANMWNEFRTTKYQVYRMILTHLRPQATVPDDSRVAGAARKQCSQIRRQMRQVSEEICCSAPYVLGLLTQERRDDPKPTVKSSCGGFALLWPLTVAALADQPSSHISEFVFQCFDILSRDMGIQQASVFREWILSSSTQFIWADSF